MQLLSRIAEPLLDLVFPPSCAGCNREGAFLCTDCEADLPRLEAPFCRTCSDPGPRSLCEWCSSTTQPFDGITAPYRWNGAVQQMVYALKYRGVRASAPRLAEFMAAHLSNTSISADLIVPVPLHRRRERKRGYNQSELLAKGIAERTGIPVATSVLTRTRDTRPQVTMKNPDERRENIAGAFECVGDVAGKHVLLIDDVVTTGATIAACSTPLRAAGVTSIWALSMAR
jgi:ComF family protein